MAEPMTPERLQEIERLLYAYMPDDFVKPGTELLAEVRRLQSENEEYGWKAIGHINDMRQLQAENAALRGEWVPVGTVDGFDRTAAHSEVIELPAPYTDLPVIETYFDTEGRTGGMDGAWRARLADNHAYHAAGTTATNAVRDLLVTLGSFGLSANRSDYAVSSRYQRKG